jgi:NADH:ubiquinone oxidoreductase subunit 5 (subunit L)/multisubunit Na+/H+ antiporter MnhA subunit
MVYGATIMLVKPDVKGALAHSTTAQMGFMILTCGLGLWAAAVIHLVAHGFYKATLFLSSGSAVASSRRHEALPPAAQPSRGQLVANVAAAVAVPAAALAVALAAVPAASAHHASEQALLAFAWVTGAAATWGWLRRSQGLGAVIRAAAFLTPAAIAYVAIITAVGPPTTLLLAWWLQIDRSLALPAAALVTLATAFNHRFRLLPAVEDVGRHSYGTIAYGGSITVLLALYWPDQPLPVAAGVLVMAAGDGLAGLVGPLLQSPRWRLLGQNKSLAGTACMALASLALLLTVVALALLPVGRVVAFWAMALLKVMVKRPVV